MIGQIITIIVLFFATTLPAHAVTYCYNSCNTTADCPANTACIDHLCRNPLCTTSNTCTCPLTTPTRIPTPLSGVTGTLSVPTPTIFINKGGSDIGACYQPCSSADACASGLTCFAGSCRNPSCLTTANCDCTITPPASSPTPAPFLTLPTPTSSLPTGRIVVVGLIWLIIMVAIFYLVRRNRASRLPPTTNP